jgi:hypothetical protein
VTRYAFDRERGLLLASWSTFIEAVRAEAAERHERLL